MTNMIFAALIPGGWEIFLIIFVVLLLFGGKKIPELMRGLGKGIREFNSARATVEDEIRKGMHEDERKELDTLRKEKEERVQSKQEGQKS
jgi:sec-independent protein translocase protein TatA